MKNNITTNSFRPIYLAGIFLILTLPILTLPPWFYPPDWGKTIIFRSVTAILLFLFIYQFFHKKQEIAVPEVKKNKIIWTMSALFGVFLLASIFSHDTLFSFWSSPYRAGGFITFGFYFVFALLLFFVAEKKDWKKFWNFSIFIGILVSVVEIIQSYGFLSNIFVSSSTSAGSTIGNPIFLGIYLLLLFFPTLAYAINEKNKKIKIFYIFSLILFLFVIFLSTSRAAYLGIVLGVLLFLLLYPKKMRALKILAVSFLLAVIAVVFYVNVFSGIDKVDASKLNKYQMLESQLLLKKVFADERFRAWQTATKEVLDKPILGWGPENLAIGFDKFYDPSVTWSPWWDKAHNVFLDIGAETGFLGIIAYLALFVALFWQLFKAKKNSQDLAKKITFTGLQATLTGYLVANFFSFDSFCTYLIFFFIIAYILHLTNQDILQNEIKNSAKKWWQSPTIFLLFLVLVVFLWQYNFVPFQLNTHLNNADILVNMGKCDNAIALTEKYMNQHSFLDSYYRMQYVQNLKTCGGKNPDKNLEYAKKGIIALKEALKIQPLYTRYWMYLGSFTMAVANNEQNQQTKQSLMNESQSYLDEAIKLSPNHIEIYTEKARDEMLMQNYLAVKQNAQKCILLDPKMGDCYWAKSLAEIYLKDYTSAETDFQLAQQKTSDGGASWPLIEFAKIYVNSQNYTSLAKIYEQLIVVNPDPQYHASLATTYKAIGEYKKAREQALEFLKLSPVSETEVNAFLATLPQ